MSFEPETNSPWPRRPTRLGIPVVVALVDQIVGGALPPGSSLPPEAALGASFGVSRTVVREAIKTLEEKGLAHARQGQGTTITEPDEWNLLDPVILEATIRHDDTMQVLDELVQVRVTLEREMVRTAAGRMTSAELDELGRLLEELDSQRRYPQRYHETDTRYHDFIMRCSGIRLGRSIIRAIHPYARASTRYNPPADDDDIRQSHLGHVAIYERLLDHDADGAAAAMEEHILGTWTLRRQKRTDNVERDHDPLGAPDPRPTGAQL
jgi:DNA-binding FadR family transcriptional regulator